VIDPGTPWTALPAPLCTPARSPVPRDVDGPVAEAPRAAGPLPESAVPVQRSTPTAAPGSTSGRGVAALLGGARSVEEQLRRLETRLLAEAGGEAAAEADVRRLLAQARARFDDAPIRQFLPILIERDVRRRLSGGG
jgi:hypothetical protein